MADPGGMRLHHVGFVVADIESAMNGFLNSLQATWDEKIFADPLQKVRVAFLSRAAGEPLIELVAPHGDGSPVHKFLTEKGGGLHHFCYEVNDLREQIQNFRSRGAILVRPAVPAVAFDGRKIAWVLTRERLLVELLERATA